MEDVYQRLALRAIERHNSLKERHGQHLRTLTAMAGAPGAGKSTIACEVVKLINTEARAPLAVVVPMDGYHYPRAYLDKLPNRDEAYMRRGAHWTFDADSLVEMIRTIRRTDRTHAVPSFDHALKDPVAGGVSVPENAEIVIIEGSWLLYDCDPWRRVSSLVDDTWFVDIDVSIARKRIANRHMEAGIEMSWEAAVTRAETNDLRNGGEIRTRLITPQILIKIMKEETLYSSGSLYITKTDHEEDWQAP